ncbi:leucine rich repeat domain-containing protein [Phthorimaea operculella]|nr:leucine rich repeat domain-containing protein [Phthorimaea operculella]
MGALSTPACALLLGALGALLLGAQADECPTGCVCKDTLDIQVTCSLPHAEITLEEDNGFKIICDSGSTALSFEDLPQMQYGLNQSIRLILHDCPIPPSFELAASRLGAFNIEDLYIYDPVGGFDITADTVKGLDSLQRMNFYDTTKTQNVTIPKEAFAKLPSLQKFTINKALSVVLGEDDFVHAPNLEYLELSNCGITKFPNGVFRPLTKVKKLNIWKNELQELTEAQLIGLDSLEELDASSNKLRSLRGIAAVPRNLRKLCAFDNHFEELTPLHNLSKLEELRIQNNRVRPLTLTPRALASLPKLRIVDLGSCGIQELPTDVFSDSPALKELIISRNNLTVLSAGVFQHQKKLETLDLSRSNISRVDANVFWPLESLKRLNLDYNRLTTLPDKCLSGLLSLTRLSVRNNNLKQLTAAMFSGANNLDDIDLSYNNITEPDPYYEPIQYQQFAATFLNLYNLTKVNLSHNQLTMVPDAIIAKPFLEKLDLSFNRIKEVNINIYSNRAKLDLRNNLIQTIYMEKATNRTDFPQPPERAEVFIDHNPFLCDCYLYPLAQRFHGFKSLSSAEGKYLPSDAKCAGPPSVAGRLLSKLPLRDYVCDFTSEAECPKNCTCLVRPYTAAFEITCRAPPSSYPDLTQNGLRNELRLTEIPQFLDAKAHVRTLNLSGLGLQDMPQGSIPQNLTMLDVSNNNLSRIPRELLDKGAVMKIARNPLVCDCWHADDVAAIQDHFSTIEDYDQVKCSSNIVVSQVNVQQLCSTWRAGVLGGVLALFGLLTAIIALLLLKYSFEIKVWLYARGMFARWLVVDDDDRKYDAFISFCHKDEDFVSEHLLPGLEDNPQPYKLCIHYRDWMPGEFITTQIAQSVADSRRTIIVVSKNFLESQWARAEFRTANMTAIKERKTRVIAILLDDVNSHKELDPELKSYLSTNTYLKWGDPWFWEKLRYALPHRKAIDAREQRLLEAKSRAARARADEARKVVRACGLDTRLTADGHIINAAALAIPTENKKCEQINLDIRKLENIKNIEDMKPIQV